MAETTIPENPAAFPDSVSVDHMDGLNFSRNKGMTMRDYFASAALSGLASRMGAVDRKKYLTEHADGIEAQVAYALADAMLRERLV